VEAITMTMANEYTRPEFEKAIVIVIRPIRDYRGKLVSPGWLSAWLDGKWLCASRQPFMDAAKILLDRGFDSQITMVARHDSSLWDVLSSTIGEAAHWTLPDNRKPKLIEPA
jgi:hypothetical protein